MLEIKLIPDNKRVKIIEDMEFGEIAWVSYNALIVYCRQVFLNGNENIEKSHSDETPLKIAKEEYGLIAFITESNYKWKEQFEFFKENFVAFEFLLPVVAFSFQEYKHLLKIHEKELIEEAIACLSMLKDESLANENYEAARSYDEEIQKKRTDLFNKYGST